MRANAEMLLSHAHTHFVEKSIDGEGQVQNHLIELRDRWRQVTFPSECMMIDIVASATNLFSLDKIISNTIFAHASATHFTQFIIVSATKWKMTAKQFNCMRWTTVCLLSITIRPNWITNCWLRVRDAFNSIREKKTPTVSLSRSLSVPLLIAAITCELH